GGRRERTQLLHRHHLRRLLRARILDRACWLRTGTLRRTAGRRARSRLAGCLCCGSTTGRGLRLVEEDLSRERRILRVPRLPARWRMLGWRGDRHDAHILRRVAPAPTPSDFAADAPWSVIRDSNHPDCQTGPMTIPSPAARTPASSLALRCLAGALLSASLLASAATAPATIAQEAAGSPDSTEFSAPAQRAAVQFDAPRQRTPAPAAGAAESSSASQADADQRPSADQRTAADERVVSLSDPATGLGPGTAAQIPE